MRIAVIIVNYGTAELTLQAAQSVIDHQNDRDDVTIYIVDNASPGDDADVLQKAHEASTWGDRVQLCLEAENLGFGRGNNVVLDRFGSNVPDYVFLLNPDASVTNDAVAVLADTLNANPKAGAAGAGVVYPNGDRAAAAFRFPKLAHEILRTINFGPLERIFGSPRTNLPLDTPAGAVDWVSGAAVMFRYSTLQEIGFFDPNFFLYYEEVELMHRLSKNGWTTLYVPSANVTHEEGAATGVGGKRRRRPFYLYDSWRYYYTKTHGRFPTLLVALCLLPAALGNHIHKRLRGQEPTVPIAFFRDQIAQVIVPLILNRGPK